MKLDFVFNSCLHTQEVPLVAAETLLAGKIQSAQAVTKPKVKSKDSWSSTSILEWWVKWLVHK